MLHAVLSATAQPGLSCTTAYFVLLYHIVLLVMLLNAFNSARQTEKSVLASGSEVG